MNWELIKECIDRSNKRYQSKGDKATYFIKVEKGLNLLKYDADCVKKKLVIEHRIGDSFFRVIPSVKKEKEILVLVETKGKGNDYFEQLHQSIEIFKEFDGNIHGRFVGLNVPAIFTGNLKPRLNQLQKKFGQKKGTLRYGNREMREEFISSKESKISNETITL